MMIVPLARFSAIFSYTAAKVSPVSSFVMLTTLLALYTGMNWFATGIVVAILALVGMAVVHRSGLMRAENHYAFNELSGIRERLERIENKLR